MRGAAAAAAVGGGVGAVVGDEYAAEMAELGGPGTARRWGSSYGGQTWGRTPQHAATAAIYQHQQQHQHAEAEDLLVRGTSLARATTTGMYYSPPGTSYTIVERPSSSAATHHHQHHQQHQQHSSTSPRSEYVRDGYGSQFKLSSSTTPRGTYLGGSNAVYTGGGGVGGGTSTNNNKKRPISPEQVLRMFGNSHHNSTTKLAPSDRIPSRRSPASSPASTTHQVSYRSPGGGYPVHELTTRTVTMIRDPPDGTHGFGICVKGGKNSGVGVYISRVEEGSVAERAGLRPGDSILEVNGTPFTGISHEEALKMLKSCRKLSMTVRSPTLPGSGVGTLYSGSAGGPWLLRQTCSWMDRQGRPVSPPLEYARTSCIVTAPAPPPPPPPPPAPRYHHQQGHSRSTSKDRSIRRVDLCIEPGQSLGLMIRGGIEYNLGIFITGVDKDSVADRAGLMVGDQILEVNGQSFLDVTHDEAVSQLKYHKRMSLLVRDVGKVPHSCTAYDQQLQELPVAPGSPGSRLEAANSARKWSAALQMVEEKARCVLSRTEFASLCYYTDEYAARHMDVESYVHVVLDLLNTQEKYTLLTELREIIAMEDRSRFDELVYNRPDPLRTAVTTTTVSGREHDYRHARRKGGGLQLDTTNHHSMLMSSLHEISAPGYERDSGGGCDIGDDVGRTRGGRSGRRHSSPGESQAGSATELRDEEYADSELAHKLSRSFDMKDEQSLLDGGSGDSNLTGGMRRHQSMQRLARSDLGGPGGGVGESGRGCGDRSVNDSGTNVAVDLQGNLRVTVRKTKPILGIAIEGGANTKHPLPRIINIHENGAAYSAGGLEVGQLILQVDGQRVEGLQHQEVARLIAESFARHDREEIEFLVVEAKKSNLEPKPTALIFLEA